MAKSGLKKTVQKLTAVAAVTGTYAFLGVQGEFDTREEGWPLGGWPLTIVTDSECRDGEVDTFEQLSDGQYKVTGISGVVTNDVLGVDCSPMLKPTDSGGKRVGQVAIGDSVNLCIIPGDNDKFLVESNGVTGFVHTTDKAQGLLQLIGVPNCKKN